MATAWMPHHRIARLLAVAVVGLVCGATTVHGQTTWTQTTAGTYTWSDIGNWTNGVPNAAGAAASVTANAAGNEIISLNSQQITLGTLNIGDTNNTNTYTIQTGTLLFNGNGSSANLTQVSTSKGDTISAGVTLGSNLNITNDSSNTLTLSGSITGNGFSITKMGSGTLTLSVNTGANQSVIVNAGVLTGAGLGNVAPTINDGGTVYSNSTFQFTALTATVNAGGRLLLGASAAPHANYVLSSGTVSGGNASGQLTATTATITIRGGGVVSTGASFIGNVGSVVNYGNGSIPVTVSSGTLSIASSIKDMAGGYTTGVTKSGTGTLVLGGSNSYTSATIVNAGTMLVDAGAGGAMLTTGTLQMGGSGAVFNYDNTTASGAKSQTVGALNFSAGETTVMATRTAAQAVTLSFGTFTRSAGATGNFDYGGTPGTIGTDSAINLTGAAAGFLNQGLFYKGSDYAWLDGAGTFVRGINYGTDAGSQSVTASTTALAGTTLYAKISGAGQVTGQTTGTITTLNIANANDFTLAAGQTLTLDGILKSGNAAGGRLTGGSGIQTGSNAEIVIRTNGAADTFDINTPILANGANAVTKAGPGLLVLSATNTFTGPITVSGGTLQIGSNGRLGTTGAYSGTMTIASGAAFVYASSQTGTIGSGGNQLYGAGDFVMQSPNTVLTANSNNTTGFTGRFLVLSGSVFQNSTGAFSNGTVYLGDTSGTNNAMIYAGAFPRTNSAPIVVQAGNTGTSTIAALKSSGGGGDYSHSGAVTLNNTLTVVANAPGSGTNSVTFSGQVTGTGGISLNGNVGLVTLSNSNSYSGTTAVSGGLFRLSNQFAAQNSTLNVTSGTVLFDSSVSGNAFTIGGLAGSGSVAIANNAASPAAIALTVGNNNASTTYSGNLTGAGSLVKVGSGTLTLSSSNAFTGATTISAGQLSIGSAGRINGSSGITLNGAGAEFKYNSATALTQSLTLTQGTLSGTGSIGVGVAIGSNVTLSPGNSPGSQTYSSGTFASGGSYTWEINNWVTGTAGVNFDQAVFTNGLAITSSTVSPFTINLTSLKADNTSGAVPGFNSGLTGLSFKIATGSMTGFVPSVFTLGTSGFLAANTLSGSANGGFWLSTDSGSSQLVLNYAPSARYTLSATPAATAIYTGSTTLITGSITNSTADRTGADAMQFSGFSVGTGSLSVTGGTLASGSSTAGTVSFSSNSTGQFTFTPTVSATNVNLATAALQGTITSGTVTVWNPAAVNTLNPVTLGNVRVNGSFTPTALSIQNTASNSIYTEFLGATGSSSGLATLTGSVSALAGGSASTAISVGLGGSTATAGVKSGSATLFFTSTGGPGTAVIDSQTIAITGTVWNTATANTISPVSLGNIRVGSSFNSQALTIQNTGTAAYTEGLKASFGSKTGGASNNAGLISVLASGSTDSTAMTVNLGGTQNTAGVISGTQAVSFWSTGVGTSGIVGDQTLNGQNVAITGTVWRLAVGSITSGTTVDLGLIHAGGSFDSQAISIQNLAANDGFSEGLNAAVSGSSGAASFGGTSFSNLGAGGSSSTITVGLANANTATGGTKNGTITIGYQSNGSTTSGLDTISAGSQTVSLTGSVFSGNGIWNVNGGGSWGTGANSNWRSTESVSAAPGTFAGYLSTDTATFNANVSGSTAVVTLGSANPSLAALYFTSGSGSYQLSGGSLRLNGGAGTGLVEVSAGSHEIDSAVSMATSSVFSVADGSSLTLSGIVSGASSGLTKTGLGLLMLSGSNTYGGNTQISQGTLKIGSSSAFGIGGGVTLANGAALDLNGFTVANAITNNGGTILGGSISGTVTASSDTTINSSLGAGAVVTVGNGVTTTFGDDATVAAGASIANNGGTVLISRTTNAVMQFAGTITGSGGLTVDGGRVKLSGANTYTGLTQVSGAGTLLAVNSQVRGNVQVGANAELGGSGLIVGNIGGSGLIGPGNSPGILTVQGQVAPTSSTSFAFEFMKTGDPIWSTGTASENDVLRLTNLTPFVTSLTGSNVVNIYFEVSSLTNGDVFRGGFFSDYSTASLDFAKAIGSPTYAYFVLGSGSGTHSYNGTNYYTLSEYLNANTGSGITGVTASVVTSGTANFSGGTVYNGQVTQFVIIPEPDTVIFAGIGIAMAGWSLWKRRRISQILRK